MPRREEFELPFDQGPVAGTLIRPDEGERFGGLLCCDHPLGRGGGSAALDRLVDAAVRSGWAVARFRGRRDIDATAAGPADEAAAVLRHLMLRDDIDPLRVAVLGFSLGTFAATGLARRTDQLLALVLIAPVTPDFAAPLLDGALAESLAELTPVEDAVFHDRPTLIVQGAADEVVDPMVSARFANAIENVGHRVDRLLVAGAGHRLEETYAADACVEHVLQFLQEAEAIRPAEAGA